MLQEDFPFGIQHSRDRIYFPDEFPIDKLKLHLQRTTVLKCFKIMTYKFNELGSNEKE